MTKPAAVAAVVGEALAETLLTGCILTVFTGELGAEELLTIFMAAPLIFKLGALFCIEDWVTMVSVDSLLRRLLARLFPRLTATTLPLPVVKVFPAEKVAPVADDGVIMTKVGPLGSWPPPGLGELEMAASDT